MNARDIEKINRSLMRDDVQGFERIRRLGGELPKVWHRYFAGDFMAETAVRRTSRRRSLTATGESLEDALDNLATAVADYLNPPEPTR